MAMSDEEISHFGSQIRMLADYAAPPAEEVGAPTPISLDNMQVPSETASLRKHRHYFKNVKHLTEVDVYRVLRLYGVTDQAIGHAIKKLLVAGGRGGGKDITRDINEAIDTLQRWQEMEKEDNQDV